MAFSKQFLEEVKRRNDIEAVVGRVVTLRRAGANLIGLCPFHSEKTPSFTVFPSTSSYYCFGCGAGGDAVTFVMQTENLDYPEAVEVLAKQAGVPMEEIRSPRDDSGPVIKRDRLYDMNREAGRFFYASLVSPAGAAARAYLEKRQFAPLTVKRFGIGYSPGGYGAPLCELLMSKGYTPEEIRAAFLGGIGKNGRMYDMFRNRIMFPVLDVNGEVVAFSGRRLNEEDERKYINTSDTPVFRKSRVLFGLNIAKNSDSDSLILCEGAPDAIAMHQAGFDNAVATLGTAITTEHARLISRYVRTVYLAYDIDKAGRKATAKGIELLNQVGVDTKILNLGSEAKDPDEYIKRFGADSFRAKLTGSSGQIDYRINEIISGYDITVAEEKLRASAKLVEYIASLGTRPEREVYASRAAQKLGMTPEALREEVERTCARQVRKQKKDIARDALNKQNGMGESINRDKIRFSSEASHEEAILGLLLVRPDFGAIASKMLEEGDFATELNRKFFAVFHTEFEQGSEIVLSKDGVFTPREIGALEGYRAARLNLGSINESTLISHIETLKELRERKDYDKKIEENPADALGEYLNKIKKKKADSREE